MNLTQFVPSPRLVVKETLIERPRFPVIDAHNHLHGDPDGKLMSTPEQLLANLDEARVRVYVDLDGGWGEDVLDDHLRRFKEPAPDRFVMFGGVNWQAWTEQGNRFPEWAAQRLRAQKERGAEGLKVWKDLGLRVKDDRGKLVAVDDPRLDPIWAAAADLSWPVMIHIADPVAFFDPLDETNERWEELQRHPDWRFPAPPGPPFLDLVNGMANVVARHPKTTFIGAHVGCHAENLAWVGDLLDRCPNFHVDISARIAELGRQPYTARRFFLRYADRILFGIDQRPRPDWYRIYYRFLESHDEYFNYGVAPVPTQGRWRIYGLHLPDNVLQRVYWGNAARILGMA